MATNQSGVTRGLYTEATLLAIHQKMQRELDKVGARIDAIEYCIHLPDAGCPCRKPQPGMLLALGQKLGVSLQGVFFVGDRITDIEAALAAGAIPVIILSPMTDQSLLKDYPEVPVYASLGAFVDDLLKEHD
jgi:D-glycero-D-manno-heptose 1,7-bisphosphate phosphatase